MTAIGACVAPMQSCNKLQAIIGSCSNHAAWIDAQHRSLTRVQSATSPMPSITAAACRRRCASWPAPPLFLQAHRISSRSSKLQHATSNLAAQHWLRAVGTFVMQSGRRQRVHSIDMATVYNPLLVDLAIHVTLRRRHHVGLSQRSQLTTSHTSAS